jgi:hypothetical protein
MSGDPVAENLVSSLNQPTGNLTGVTTFSGVLTSKRLELLRELGPLGKDRCLDESQQLECQIQIEGD